MKKYMLATGSLIAFIATTGLTPAFAQTEVSATDTSSSAQNSSSGLSEIIVTAQRREERNQDVPIAITAFSPERLQQQNVKTAQDLNGLIPSLSISSQGQSSREVEGFILRGQGPTYQGASSVVTYLSEVPLPQGFTTSQQGGPGNFVDLENVQVLAGPQGTLFGRNTTGGAVLLVPHKPTNEFEGYVQASYGNHDYVGVEGALNIPVIEDKLLVRASGIFQDRDGYTQDLVWNKDRDDLHYYAGRIGITFKPTERIENYLLAYGARSSNNGTSYILQGMLVPQLISSGQCSDAASCAVYVRQEEIQKEIGPRKSRPSLDQFERTRTWGVINKTSIELTDELTVNNIISYQRYWKDFEHDEDGSPLQISDLGTSNFPDGPIPGFTDEFGLPRFGYLNEQSSGIRDNQKQFTEEFQLQGNMLDNHLTFTTGAFYYSLKPVGVLNNKFVANCAAENTGVCPPPIQDYGVSIKSKALYAQATLDLGALTPGLEGLRLTGGYRYTWDTTRGFSTFYLTGPIPGFITADQSLCLTTFAVVTDPNACRFDATLKSKAPTWTVGLDYKPMSNLLLYGKISRGYKAGGFNPFAVRVSTQTFKPEFVTTYEAGFKSDWRIGTAPARLNVTAYTSDYKDAQRGAVDFNAGAIGAQSAPADARIRGVEADATIRPFPQLELGGNMSYTDAKYKKYFYVAPTDSVDCDGPVAQGSPYNATCLAFGVAKWIYSVHASLDVPVPETLGKLNLFVNYSHMSKLPLAENEPGGVLEPFGLLNLTASLRGIAGSSLDLELFMKNATNKLYRISNSNISGSGYYSSLYGEPRMYGARVRYTF